MRHFAEDLRPKTSSMGLPWRLSTQCCGYVNSDKVVLVAKLCPTLLTPWAVACQAPLSMGFSRQEYWSGLPFPSPGDLPDPGIEPGPPALQADFFFFFLAY